MAALPMTQNDRHFHLRVISKTLLISLLFAITISLSSRSSTFKLPALRPQPDIVLSKSTVERSEISRDIFDSANTTRLQRRDQYACKKGTPCTQNACCGSFDADGNGECGLGPTWCGADCDSKCHARAECGSWADPVGKTCPLNVCCSPFGFCGSTAEYCDASSGCQSNCDVDPPVPGGKSSSPVLNRVIGYYEGNSRTCHAFPPSAIPVDGLTHVNFAFGYIDPSSLKITPMDSSTPEDLFTQVTDIRTQSAGDAGVEIFISIGGWSFSDNGTATQDVFGSIAADAAKRQEFANNLVSFMKQFGFDGVDLDWEYPGAPDRGGKVADTKNYVLLLKTLRETFSASGRGKYGITFTIPSSYWYLRWFDLPGMVEYVDWINLMSYDLHGVWDSEDPIGSIVQGHTNLTEIKLSVDLLWRVNIPPAKVVLGLGFYGRSFQLSDKSCSKPGCDFKGAAAAGPCTNSGGTLAYFEIMDIINKEKPKVQYDTAAAVNYIQFGASNDQWVSYDDKKTFKQKIDFANSVGLGGVMIWSIDQDDNDFTALSGLVGKSLPSFAEQLKKTATIGTNKWASQNGQKCVMTDCSDHPNGPDGYNLAPNGGAFPDTCSRGKNRYIYCPVDAMPSGCQWRGSGSCHGQCHAGEVTLFHSRHGSKSCLRPGQQAFCCASNTWANLIRDCAWNGVDSTTCPDDKPYDISYRYRSVSICPGGAPPCVTRRYKEEFCCSYNFQGCHWVGKGTCDDNECSDTDIELVLDSQGATGSSCGGSSFSGRVKPLCCNTPNSLSPFLPVPLEDIFPTLPPAADIPVFDSQQIASGGSIAGESNPQAFGLVVIDGPPDAVTSLSKRDGSHIRFLDCDQRRSDESRTARFICTNSSDKSNCDDMHKGGLAGTILKMPEECGFATYAVGHAVSSSSSQNLPKYLKKRTPPNAVVYDLEYSYDFSLAKRDSGEIFVRIDYSDSRDYYDQVVSAAHQRRDVHPRFWSKSTSIWKNLLQNLRASADNSFSPSISKDNFDILLYGNDGSKNKCKGSDADGFLKIGVSGSISSSIKWGVTFVGTIAPSLRLEEAFSYFDSNPKLTGTLVFDGKGVLDIGAGESASLFQSSLTNYEFSHPGIVSFQPQLNVDVQLVGKGKINGKFTVDFAQGNQATLRTNAPLAVGDFGGSAAGKTPNNAFKGDVTTGAAISSASSKQKRQSRGGLADGTVFALQLNLQNSLAISLFDYDTTVITAGASLNAKIPHAIRVINNGGSGGDQIAVIDGDLVALGEVYQTGSIASTWTDDVSHTLGAIPHPNRIHLGSSDPPTRNVPQINGYSIFGDKDYIDCSDDESGSAILICTYDLHLIDPGLDIDPDTAEGNPSNTKKRSILDLMARGLAAYGILEERSRTSGASQGYNVYNPNGNGEFLTWHSATYPSGSSGNDLDQENGRSARYGIANPADCTDGSISDQANVNNPNYQYVTEHPVERQTIPVFLQYAMTGQLDLQNGNTHQSPLTRVTFDSLASNFNNDYRIWAPGPNAPPGSGAADVADGLGSSDHADPLANLEANLNGYKAIVWDSFTNPTSNSVFNRLLTTNQQDTEQALSLLRAGLAAFNYINDPNIHEYIVNIHQNIQAALENYDTVYNNHFNPAIRQNVRALWNEFFPLWLQRIVNYHRTYLQGRLTSLRNVWTPVAANPNASPQQRAVANAALTDIQAIQGQINTVVTINMNGIP